MEVDEQIARIRADGETLARAAEDGPLDAPVPGCPDWDVEALLRHIGWVHRWAAKVVGDRAQERVQGDFEGPAGRDALVQWYRDGCHALVETLEAAAPEDAFWFWGPAPNPLAFWVRRQANETAVHRCDAESARGSVTPLAALDAVDALDEWFGLAVRRAKAPDGSGRIVRLVATDTGTTWSLILGDRVEITSDRGRGHCELRGPASDLYLWSMNRRGTDGITVSGDDTLLEVWADNVRF
jgi:uncharacterized protein (TIGR03083 family)